MIWEGEVRRAAARRGVDAMVVDLDYSQSWLLAGLQATAAAPGLVRFKGGTCLRKCYFSDYRFSEDLDFSSVRAFHPDELVDWLHAAGQSVAERSGPDLLAAPVRTELVQDDSQGQMVQARAYYRGPLGWDGTPRGIRLDVTGSEALALPAVRRGLFHPYSDSVQLHGVLIDCYALEEILAEKIRAVCGQRRFAIARDIYDIHQLVTAGVDLAAVGPLIPAKFSARGVDVALVGRLHLAERAAAMEIDWQRRLAYLTSGADRVDFPSAWKTTLDSVDAVGALLNRGTVTGG